MSDSQKEFFAGLFVLVGLITVAYLSLHVAGTSYGGPGGLEIFADFNEIAQLKIRAPVMIAGVKVGEVADIALTADHRARVTMDLREDLKLDVDASASVVTAGVLGERYVVLQPGGSDKLLGPGGQVYLTEDAVILERILGKLITGDPVGGEEREKKRDGEK
jgi:phospholipid/cholesterol/gamma-HCH transport system substrate-binding protein